MKKFQERVKNDLEYIGKYIFNEHNMGNKVKKPSKNNVPLVMAHWHIAVRLISEKLHCVSKFLSKKSFLVNLTKCMMNFLVVFVLFKLLIAVSFTGESQSPTN